MHASTASYVNSFIFIYVADVCTSQEHIYWSLRPVKRIAVRTSPEIHVPRQLKVCAVKEGVGQYITCSINLPLEICIFASEKFI
jgi:hypothetical protein